MSGVPVFAAGAALVALAAWWVLRAYVRAEAAGASPRAPLAAGALCAAAALGLYALIGSPLMDDGAYADRMQALRARAPESFTVEEAVAVLNDAAKRNPRDAEPLVILGEIEAESGRAEPAVVAFEEALRRDPRALPALVGLGRVLVARERGNVNPYARNLFVRARELAPEMPEPPFYLALAAHQAGEAADAETFFRQALTLMPPDDPRRAMINQMLEQP